MISLTLDADIAEDEDLLGLNVGDLQTGIEVGTDSITGTLKYVTGYTGFSGDAEEQEGNYLALHAECADADSVSIRLAPKEEEKTIDADGLMILRITDKTTQKLHITAHKSGEEDYERVYSLEGLTLEEE